MEKAKKSFLDKLIIGGFFAIVILMVIITFIVLEQNKAYLENHKEYEKKIELLNIDISRNEEALVNEGKRIQTLEKILETNNIKEKSFIEVKEQLEKVSKTVPKPKK